jgi:hypothetical protein
MGRLLDVGFATDLQTLDGKVMLAELETSDGEADPAPPTQLSSAECAYGVSATSIEAGLTGGGLGGGWALIFGASSSKAHAQQLLGQARQQLKPVLAGGRAVILPKQWEGVRRYSALLAGLSKEQAGKACKHLWSVGTYCLALSPQVLRHPQAVWR